MKGFFVELLIYLFKLDFSYFWTMTEFLAYLNQYISLSNDAEQEIINSALIENVSKGHIILKEGKTCAISRRFRVLSFKKTT